jgi:intracellular multiplication protein IcmE
MLDDPEFAKAMAVHNANAVSSLMNNDPAFKKALLEKVPGINTILRQAIPFLNDKERLQALDEARRIQKAEQAQREQQLQLTEQQQKTLAAILTNMEAESKTAFQAWSEIPTQAFVQGEGKKEDQEKNKGGNSSNTGKSGNDPDTCSSNNTLIKAGTIFFAVLDTAVNTDEPGPIMATIVQGKFKGSKILGDVQFASQSGSNDRAEKVTLNFSTLSSPSDDKSIGIKGVAIDPDTARTALASAVDHHYLLRYGTLFASSFMTGYAKVISSQGGTVQTNPASGTTTTTTPPLNGRQQIFAALGQVGQNLGEATSTYFSSPNTITVNAGTGFGLLILSDVSKS